MSERNFDAWLDEAGNPPSAVVMREYLVPVEGRDGVLFPPTFAAAEDSRVFPGGYNIDEIGNGENVCLIDSVGSQANRIEPMFAASPYAELVPQIVVKAGSKSVNLLEAGHRAGDAIVRCTSLGRELKSDFEALRSGNAVPLAKKAPTSLVFGVWDSRDTQAKAPRLLAASIRAFNVAKLRRSAQYNPAAEYVEEGLLAESENKDVLKAYSERGFRHVPASGSHGGVIARGGIRRDVTLQLAALRLLRGASPEETTRVRAYLLGLALLAFTKPAVGYLRQGCNLVLDAERPPEAMVVYPDGKRQAFDLGHQDALAYAKRAAAAFGVGEGGKFEFDMDIAKADTAGEGKKGKAKSK